MSISSQKMNSLFEINIIQNAKFQQRNGNRNFKAPFISLKTKEMQCNYGLITYPKIWKKVKIEGMYLNIIMAIYV